MKEEEKYYTPDISEFYIGFRYEEDMSEVYDRDPNWVRIKCEQAFGAFDDDIDSLEENKIRIKYLDIQDIESCGFRYLPSKSLRKLTERFQIEGLHRRLCEANDDTMYWNVYLVYNPDLKRIKITADISDGIMNEKFYEGTIKNLSELKKLLKQLNINNE